MNSPVLQAFPAFRLRPPADCSASAEVVDANDVVVGQVDAAGGAYRGHAGTDAGPQRTDALRAAEDVAVFRIALHGPAGAEHLPYTGVAQGQEIVDSSTPSATGRPPPTAPAPDGVPDRPLGPTRVMQLEARVDTSWRPGRAAKQRADEAHA
ncbi:hypothetical protein ACIA78_21520 [Streptomyces xanthochromogenes]|uniref:hypothetical protein n=1 Tax=Streptomyces xanthochromogenes TaxID=67384 RepID=UPI0037ADC805